MERSSIRPVDLGVASPPNGLPAGEFSAEQTKAFEELCSSYRPALRSVIEARIDTKLNQRIDPSDVVQEALLEAFTRLEAFHRRQPMPIESWLRETAVQQLRIAVRRHAIAGRRSVMREVCYEQSSVYRLAEQLTAVFATAEERHQETEDALRTRQALANLSHLDREILLLRYINGLSNSATARFLGVTETVASKRHCRALVRLQKHLVEM